MPIIGEEVLSYAIEKAYELTDAPTRNSETKAAAKVWLDAVGTENEAAKTKKYINELEADIMPIDGLVGFMESDAGNQALEPDKAKGVAAHAKKIRAAGVKFCDCPACAAVKAVPNEKEGLLRQKQGFR